MKTFTKVFIVSFLCFFVAYFMGSVSYLQKNNLDVAENMGFGSYEKENVTKKLISKLETKPKEVKTYKSLEEAKNDSSIVNFLILGMEDVRTDTILLASFNRDSKKINVISIPRDTYVHRKNFNSGEERKINSVYYSHGVNGVKQTVSYVLEDIPIHHHIMVDYDGVEKIVDLLGGVDVDVPFPMKYRDPTAKPPLNIDIKEGKQTLDGKNALNYIRWRKNNNNKGYVDGDIGRIKAQQKLLTSLTGKAKDNILSVITKGFNYIETDIGLLEAITYGRSSIGIKDEDIVFKTLPGESELRPINKRVLSYYIFNQNEVMKLLKDIYNVKEQ